MKGERDPKAEKFPSRIQLLQQAVKEGFFGYEKTSKEWAEEYEKNREQGAAGRYALVAGVFRSAAELAVEKGLLSEDFFVSRHPIDISLLPFDFDKRFEIQEKIGEGFYKRAYVVRPKETGGYLGQGLKPFVVTWNRRPLLAGTNPEASAARFLATRTWIEKTYESAPEILTKEHMRLLPIVRGKKGELAIVTVVELLEGELTDFMRACRSGFFSILTSPQHASLRAQVETFVTRTLAAYNDTKLTLDLNGEMNVVLVPDGQSLRLKILDQHSLARIEHKEENASSESGMEINEIVSASERQRFLSNIATLQNLQKWLRENPVSSDAAGA